MSMPLTESVITSNAPPGPVSVTRRSSMVDMWGPLGGRGRPSAPREARRMVARPSKSKPVCDVSDLRSGGAPRGVVLEQLGDQRQRLERDLLGQRDLGGGAHDAADLEHLVEDVLQVLVGA